MHRAPSDFFHQEFPQLLVLSGLVLLVACPGSLLVDLAQDAGTGDDDDSAGALNLDFSDYAGSEQLNIDWDDDQRADHLVDCSGTWTVVGQESTAENAELCPGCDHIWDVTLTAQPGAQDCLLNTGLTIEDHYSQKLGIELEDSGSSEYRHFRLWRNQQSPGAVLEPVGIGAIRLDNGTFTWSGDGQYEIDGELSYSYFFSGEGTF